MTLISYLSLLAAGLLDLAAMVRHDMLALQQCGFNSQNYNKLLKENAEIYSTKRLLPLAVLIGACTTMAQMSWIVVLILAAVVLAQALYLLWSKREKSARMGKRSWSVYGITLALAIIIPALVSHFIPGDQTKSFSAATYTVLLEVLCSPVLVMLVNWLLPGRKAE